MTTEPDPPSDNAIQLARMLVDMMTAMAATAAMPETSTSPNYTAITLAWTGNILTTMPFDRVEIAFIRPGAVSPSSMAELRKIQLEAERERRRLVEAELTDLKLIMAADQVAE